MVSGENLVWGETANWSWTSDRDKFSGFEVRISGATTFLDKTTISVAALV